MRVAFDLVECLKHGAHFASVRPVHTISFLVLTPPLHVEKWRALKVARGTESCPPAAPRVVRRVTLARNQTPIAPRCIAESSVPAVPSEGAPARE